MQNIFKVGFDFISLTIQFNRILMEKQNTMKMYRFNEIEDINGKKKQSEATLKKNKF